MCGIITSSYSHYYWVQKYSRWRKDSTPYYNGGASFFGEITLPHKKAPYLLLCGIHYSTGGDYILTSHDEISGDR